MTGAENLIVSHGLTTYLIAGIGFLASALAVVVGFVIKMAMTKIKSQIIICKNELMTEVRVINAHAEETRKIADANADDMQHHVNIFEHKKR